MEPATATVPLLLLPGIYGDVAGGERRSSSTSGSATAVIVFSTFVAVLGSFVFSCAVEFSSTAQSEIREDLGLSLAQYSLFGSLLTIGAMIGAVVSGKLADIFGRRGAMGIAELLNIAGWLAIAFSKVHVYIAEITPKNRRGAFAAVNQLMLCCGVSIMYLAGNVITWRLLALMSNFPSTFIFFDITPVSCKNHAALDFLLATIPCVMQLVGLILIPESPRWLAMNGQWDGSETSLMYLRGNRENILEEAAEIRVNF